MRTTSSTLITEDGRKLNTLSYSDGTQAQWLSPAAFYSREGEDLARQIDELVWLLLGATEPATEPNPLQ